MFVMKCNGARAINNSITIFNGIGYFFFYIEILRKRVLKYNDKRIISYRDIFKKYLLLIAHMTISLLKST